MRVRDFENLIAQSRAKSVCATALCAYPKRVLSRKRATHPPVLAQSRANRTASRPWKEGKMSATKIGLRDYLETFRGIVPDAPHPAGAVTIWGGCLQAERGRN
jgi:hypothetical protein